MRKVYLSLAIVGAIVPLVCFAQFFATGGTAMGFVPALLVNGASAGFSADLIISSVVFWCFMQVRRPQGPPLWPYIALNLCIGLSCALPAYLYRSEVDEERRCPQ